MNPRLETSSRKALLLRVGIDRGTGGALGPIFRDGSFEYIPIPEAMGSRCSLTYAELPGRYCSSLAAVLPTRLAQRRAHLDPDFETTTYGDAAPRKRRQLLRLEPEDLLVFYTGLAPRPAEDRPCLFVIGSFQVRQVYHLSAHDIGRADLQQKFGQTAHFLRRPRDHELALVEGRGDASKLFPRALPIADGRDCLLRDLACFGYQGSLLRAVGHWINQPLGLRSLDLWLRRGPPSLVDRTTRLVPIIPTALHKEKDGHDLVIDDPRPEEGDWIIARAENSNLRVQTFARVNRVMPVGARRRAFSSLFWHFENCAPTLGGSLRFSIPHDHIGAESLSIRRLVSWFTRHYRIGFHRLNDQTPHQSKNDIARFC